MANKNGKNKNFFLLSFVYILPEFQLKNKCSPHHFNGTSEKKTTVNNSYLSWTKSELFSKKIRTPTLEKLRPGGQKGRGLGRRNFARPRFSATAKFRISLREMRRQRCCL